MAITLNGHLNFGSSQSPLTEALVEGLKEQWRLSKSISKF